MSASTNPASGLAVDLRPEELRLHWKRCGQTADWMASYLAHDIESAARNRAKSVLSTIINELLENAVKFCVGDRESIRIVARHQGSFVRIETFNTASRARAILLEQTLEELGRVALDSLFARRVAARDVPDAPGVGLLIIQRDYGVRVGATLTPRGEESRDVHVSVEVDVATWLGP